MKLTDIRKTPLRAAQILKKIGEVQEAQQNFDQALNAYQQAVSLYEASDKDKEIADLILVADLTLRIGALLMRNQQFSHAADRFRHCLELVEGNPDVSPDLRFAAMANMALSLAKIDNKTVEAIAMFEKANDFHQVAGLPLSQDYFVSQLNFARILADWGNTPEAISIYTNALDKLGPDSDDTLRYTLKAEMGIAHLEAHNYDSALSCINAALPFFEMKHEEFQLASLYANLGTIYRKQGLTEQSVNHYRKAHPLLLKFAMTKIAKEIEAYM